MEPVGVYSLCGSAATDMAPHIIISSTDITLQRSASAAAAAAAQC